MKYRVICVGKIKETYYEEMIASCVKELKKYHPTEILQVKDEGIPKHASDLMKQKIIETESARCMEKLEKTDFVIALCIEGKKYTTPRLARLLKDAETNGRRTAVFLIGGSLGMSRALLQRANVKLSFSDMTFPHQLMRVMLLDQLVRASIYDTECDG